MMNTHIHILQMLQLTFCYIWFFKKKKHIFKNLFILFIWLHWVLV